MYRVKLLLFLFFSHSAHAFSEWGRPLDPYSLKCVPYEQKIVLGFSDDMGDLRIVDFAFDTRGPYVPEIYSCQRWIRTIHESRIFSENGELTYKELVSRDRGAVAPVRLTGSTRKLLYQNCTQSKFCRVPFPYWLFHPMSAIPRRASGDVCRTQGVGSSAIRVRNGAEISKWKWPKLESGKFWVTPQSSFSNEIASNLLQKPKDLLFVSTFTLSLKESVKLKGLAKKKGSTVFVLSDLNAMIHAEEFEAVAKENGDGFFFVPVFQYPGGEGTYHIKGAVANGGTTFIFTSSNLKKLAVNSSDIGITANQTQVKQSLMKVFAEKVHETCQNLSYLDCLLDAKFGLDSTPAVTIKKTIQQSCAAFNSVSETRSVRLQETTEYFLQASKVRVEDVARVLASESRKSVLGATDKLSGDTIFEIMREADSNGLQVRVIASDSMYRKSDTLAPSFLVQPDYHANSTIPRAHSKGLLFDDKLLFWGSGNLSLSGLTSENELFAITDDAEMIEGFRRYLNFYSPHR